MSATITGSCNPSPTFTYTGTTGFLTGQGIPVGATIQAIFQISGVLADQVDTLYANTLVFTASTPQTLDLSTLTDIEGNSINFARVRLLAVRVRSTTDGQVLLMGDSVTNEWDAFISAGATITVYPSTSPTVGTGMKNSGFVVLSAPNTTGAPVTSSHKTLKLDPGTNAFSVDIIIAGCSS